MRWISILIAAGVGSALVFGGQALASGKYRIDDQGAFGQTGRALELADRCGWKSYEINFSFDFDERADQISKSAEINLTIDKLDGGSWSYRCRNRKDEMLSPLINHVQNLGVSVQVECRIPPGKFSKLTGVDSDLVGDPRFVFQAVVQEGKVVAGELKGLYIRPVGQIDGGDLKEYATFGPDELSVPFVSQTIYPN